MRSVRQIITSGLGSPSRIILQGFSTPTPGCAYATINPSPVTQGFATNKHRLVTNGFGGAAQNKLVYEFTSIIHPIEFFDSLITKKDSLSIIHGLWV